MPGATLTRAKGMWPGLHKNLGISRTTSANSKQKEKSGVHRPIVACLRCVCRYIICPTVGSEVQEIRGWGKHSAELLWERFQDLAEGVEQVPSAQCWFCQVVLGEVRSPVAPVQNGAGCLLSGQLCRGAGGHHWDVLEQWELPSPAQPARAGGGREQEAWLGLTAGRREQMLLCQSSLHPPIPTQESFVPAMSLSPLLLHE